MVIFVQHYSSSNLPLLLQLRNCKFSSDFLKKLLLTTRSQKIFSPTLDGAGNLCKEQFIWFIFSVQFLFKDIMQVFKLEQKKKKKKKHENLQGLTIGLPWLQVLKVYGKKSKEKQYEKRFNQRVW